MSRSFYSVAMQAARAVEHGERARIRAQVASARQMEREAKLQDRLDKRSYQESRAAAVEQMNRDLATTIADLESLLQSAIARRTGVDWLALKRNVNEAELDKHPHLRLSWKPELETFLPEEPSLLKKLIPGWKQRHDARHAEARAAFEEESQKYGAVLSARQAHLKRMQAEVADHNQRIDAFREAYRAGEPEAVCGYLDIVFEQSDFPQGSNSTWKTAFIPESKQIVVEFHVPAIEEIVPSVEKYRYTKSADQIAETKKSSKLRGAIYASCVAQMALIRLHEIFKTDQEEIIETATVSVFVEAIDPSSGLPVRPCLVSVRTTRDDFNNLDLRYVDALACLKRLNASVSKSPSELSAVKPVIDFDMVDPRFIQESDVLSTLDSRPNLMELTPSEFENLITNLFQRMGLETKQTQASRDGGVDCIAFDTRPVFGGKVVIQAKRYKDTVGVSAVRDLFGTMLNEGASKGILITTSGYGNASFEFANGKPIELMSGSNLLYLLKEHAGVDAKIELIE
jgi:restriction system protein